MGNLKIGKQPKRIDKPSAKFLEKKSLEGVSRRKTEFQDKWVRAQTPQLPPSTPFVMAGVDTVAPSVGIYQKRDGEIP